MKLINNTLYWVLHSLVYLFSLLPLRVHYWISSVFAYFLANLLRYRMSTVNVNMARAFPELRYNELKLLSKQFYKHMSDVLFESIWAFSAPMKKFSKLVEVKNPDVLSKVVEEHGNVVVVLGHQGNWEFVAAWASNKANRHSGHYAEANFVIGYKGSNNKIMDRLMYNIRMATFDKFEISGNIAESSELFRYILNNKDKKNMYILIADQSTPFPKYIVNFLHQETNMFNGPEHIARKTKMPIVYANNYKASRGKYEVTFELITEDASKETEGYVTKRFAELLEKGINENKFSWLWSHKRWKGKFDKDDKRLIFL